jgi:23S rRNA pseudouridine1911/1915/1917 synthase
LHKPKENSGEIISYIKKDSKLNRVKNSAVMFDGAKKSVLNYSCLKTSKSKLPILEIILKTGRPHQIRVQLNSIDCPILGDLKYYNQKPLPDKSIALHAHSLRFVHPVQQVSLHFIAPYPDKSWWK